MRMADTSGDNQVPLVSKQIYLGNIPLDVDEGQLTNIVREKIGSSFQTIRLVKDMTSGQSKGFAYIDFEIENVAQEAVSSLSTLEIQGAAVKVNLATPRGDKARKLRDAQENAIYIGNLAFDVSENDILSLCREILPNSGTPRIRMATDPEGRPRGFCHASFEKREDADAAIAAMNGNVLSGRALKVDRAQRRDPSAPREERTKLGKPREQFGRRDTSPSHSVFIGNLAWSVNDELIKEMVDDILGQGLYTKVRLAFDRETGRSKGFGHIDFKDAASADRAIAELNGLEVMGREIRADHAEGGKPGARSGLGRPPRGNAAERYGTNSATDESGSFGSW